MTFKNDKERQLLMLEEKKVRKQYKREAMNPCKEPIQKKQRG